MLTLYTFFRSSTSFRLRIALGWKGLAWEPKYVSLPKMEHRTGEYLALNPQGGLPALVDEAGRVFTQSMAMIEYLDEIHPEPPLMPKTPEEKWYVRAVSQAIGCEMHPLNNTRVLKYLRAHGMSEDQVNREWYGHWIAEGFRGIEGFLAREKRHGRYCLGERFTMADVCLVPQVANAMRFQCDLSPYPLVTRIYEACAALDAVKQADPAVQGDRV